ncbi:MAG: amidohydrolase family protein [Planctomycetes bacterium]|nr:amidohydrolase family protein [Planctomycetota bacterium]
MDTVIKNGTVITGDGKAVLEKTWVGIEDDRICAVSRNTDALAGAERGATQVIDAAEMLVIPGVINAHTHGCSVGPLFSSAAAPLSMERVLRNVDRHLLQGTTTLVNVCGMGLMEEVDEVARRHVVRIRAGTNHFPSAFKAARMVDGAGLTPRHLETTAEAMLEAGAVLLGEAGSGATLGGGVSIYKYIPEAIAGETGVHITAKQAEELKQAVLGRVMQRDAFDADAVAKVLHAYGLGGKLSVKRAREIVDSIAYAPAESALVGFREAASLSAKTSVPVVFHNALPSGRRLLELAQEFEGTRARLVAGHTNHNSFSVEESVRIARDLRNLGVVIDISTLDGAITRWMTGPEHIEALLSEDLVDTISTDYAGGHWDGILEMIQYAWRRGLVTLPRGIAMATGNVARTFPEVAPDRGLIEPGKVADMVLVDQTNVGRVEKVLIGGSLVADGGWCRFNARRSET